MTDSVHDFARVHEFVELDTLYSLIDSYDYAKPVAEWKRPWIKAILDIYNYSHNHCLVPYVDKNGIAKRLISAYLWSDMDIRVNRSIINTIVAHHMKSYRDDVTVVYNMLAAAVKLHSTESIDMIMSAVNPMTATECLRVLIFGMVSVSIPEDAPSLVVDHVYSKYVSRSSRINDNTNMAISMDRSDYCVKYFFCQDVIDAIIHKRYRDVLKMSITTFIEKSMTELIETCVRKQRHIIITWMAKLLRETADQAVVDSYFLKKWKMNKPVGTHNVHHPLYDCDRETFIYFQTIYGDRMIRDAYMDAYVSADTFSAIRDVYAFKYYTVFTLYNIIMTAPREIDSLPFDIDLHDYVVDFDSFVNRFGTECIDTAAAMTVVDIVVSRTRERERVSIRKHIFKSCGRMPDAQKYALLHHCYKHHREYFDGEWDDIFVYLCRNAIMRIGRKTFEALPMDDIMTYVQSDRLARATAEELLMRMSKHHTSHVSDAEIRFLYAIQLKLPEFRKEHYSFVAQFGRFLCFRSLVSPPMLMNISNFFNKIMPDCTREILISKYYTGRLFTSYLIDSMIPSYEETLVSQYSIVGGDFDVGLKFDDCKLNAAEDILHNIFMMYSPELKTIVREKSVVVTDCIVEFLKRSYKDDERIMNYFSVFVSIIRMNMKNYNQTLGKISIIMINCETNDPMITINVERCIHMMKNTMKLDRESISNAIETSMYTNQIRTLYLSHLARMFCRD